MAGKIILYLKGEYMNNKKEKSKKITKRKVIEFVVYAIFTFIIMVAMEGGFATNNPITYLAKPFAFILNNPMVSILFSAIVFVATKSTIDLNGSKASNKKTKIVKKIDKRNKYKVVLKSSGEDYSQVSNMIQKYGNISMQEADRMAEYPPCNIIDSIEEFSAFKLKYEIEKIGGKVVLKKIGGKDEKKRG